LNYVGLGIYSAKIRGPGIFSEFSLFPLFFPLSNFFPSVDFGGLLACCSPGFSAFFGAKMIFVAICFTSNAIFTGLILKNRWLKTSETRS
jgi:hypothetical protein